MEQNPQQPEKQSESIPQQENLLEDMYDYNSMEGYDKPVRNARIILFVIAVLQLIPIFTLPDGLSELARWIAIGIQVFLAGVFVALGFWTKRKPYTAIITALCVFTGIILLEAVLSGPLTLVKGWLIKAVVYGLLITALRNAKEVQEWLDTKHQQR